MKISEFVEACKQIGINLSAPQLEQFRKYAELLIEWNEKMNLTAIVELEEIYEKHFFDCLLISSVTKIEGSLCDVGAGAGFPSIPLKIAFPQLKVTILEPLGKRVIFLKELCKQLGLANVECINARAEDYAMDHRETFDIVSARAVANLQILSELCIPLVKKDGYFIAMKGSLGHIEQQEAQKAIGILGAQFESEQEIVLKDQSKRLNILYKKIKNTPTLYPRPYGKIKKRPL